MARLIEADKLLKDWIRLNEDKHYGGNMLYVVSDLIESQPTAFIMDETTDNDQVENNPTVEEIFDESFNKSGADISIATLKRYKSDFNRYYGDLRKRRIKSITAQEMVLFLRDQVSQQMTYKAFCNLKTVTRYIFEYARKQQLIDWRISHVYEDLDVTRDTLAG